MSESGSKNPVPLVGVSPRAHLKGGLGGHKPDCGCIPCKARRRKEEALSPGDRPPTPPVEQSLVPAIDADAEDLPIVVAHGRTARDRVTQWIELRAKNPGISTAEVARRLGIAPNSLSAILSRAKKAGWLTFEDPLTRLEHEILPKAVDNLKYWLDEKDKIVTVEVMKGIGFPTYREAKGIQENKPTLLALKIELPEVPSYATGAISGVPKVPVIEAEIVGEPDKASAHLTLELKPTDDSFPSSSE